MNYITFVNDVLKKVEQEQKISLEYSQREKTMDDIYNLIDNVFHYSETGGWITGQKLVISPLVFSNINMKEGDTFFRVYTNLSKVKEIVKWHLHPSKCDNNCYPSHEDINNALCDFKTIYVLPTKCGVYIYTSNLLHTASFNKWEQFENVVKDSNNMSIINNKEFQNDIFSGGMTILFFNKKETNIFWEILKNIYNDKIK
jgi:hypothetical protein